MFWGCLAYLIYDIAYLGNWQTLLWYPFVAFIGWVVISAFYHRALAHPSWECPDWLKYPFAFFAPGLGVTPAIVWCSLHREHHRHSDIKGNDPFSFVIKAGTFMRLPLTFLSKTTCPLGLRPRSSVTICLYVFITLFIQIDVSKTSLFRTYVEKTLLKCNKLHQMHLISLYLVYRDVVRDIFLVCILN